MKKIYLKVQISSQLNEQIKELAVKSKSDFVRQAIEEKIEHETFQNLENQWISALKKDLNQNYKSKS